MFNQVEAMNATPESFHLRALIDYEEKLLAVLRWRRNVLSNAMMIENDWDPEDGAMGDAMLKKVAMKHDVHAAERLRGSDHRWNVSVGDPWFVPRHDEPPSGDLAAAAELVNLSQKLERQVWCSRGECPGWKSNLLEDMKDALWLLLKGSFETGWYRASPTSDVRARD